MAPFVRANSLDPEGRTQPCCAVSGVQQGQGNIQISVLAPPGSATSGPHPAHPVSPPRPEAAAFPL